MEHLRQSVFSFSLQARLSAEEIRQVAGVSAAAVRL